MEPSGLKPNPYQTPAAFKETIQGHRSAWGNGYARIVWDKGGRPRQLLPLLPDRTQPVRKDGVLLYQTKLNNGQTEIIPSEDVIHIPGMGFDGLRGYSPIYMARQAIALSLAAETFGARFFGNGTWAAGVLEHPGRLGPNAIQNLRDGFNSMHQGSQNAWKPAILEEGMKWHSIAMPMEDAQFLQTRTFQIKEIARMYRVPPHMLAELDRATHSNIEHQSIEFVQYTLLSHLTKWKQELNRKLFAGARGKYYVEFDYSVFLKSDTASRMDTYTKAINAGVYSINEARAKEGLNPIEGGDLHLRPLNMQPVDAEEQGEDQPEQEEGSGLMSMGSKPDETTPEADRSKPIAKAQARVFADAAARLIRKEVDRARRFVGKDDPAAFEAWLGKFYDEHRAHVRDSLLPVTESTLELLVGPAPDLTVRARKILEVFADQHCKIGRAHV